MTDKYLTTKQLAEQFKVSDRFVRAMAASGEWPHLKLGPRTYRFTTDHVKQIESLSTPVPHHEVTDFQARKKNVLKKLHSA